MKKHLFILFIFCFTNNINSQCLKYRNFKDTKWSIITPENFTLENDGNGFINKELKALISYKEVNISYALVIKEWDKTENLTTRGLTLLKHEEIEFNNSKATYFYLKLKIDGVSFIQQLLIYGNEKTNMVLGIYPENNISIENEIKNSIKSVSYINN